MTTLTIPNTFTASTSAVAAEVNANFTALKNFIDAYSIDADGTTQFTGLQKGPTGVDPTHADHLARKGYVDSAITAGTSARAVVGNAVALIDESSDTTCFPVFAGEATGDRLMLTDASSLTYNASTGALASTSFVGALTGNADTATNAGNADTATNVQTAFTDFNPTMYSSTTAYTTSTNNSCWRRTGNFIEVMFHLVVSSNGTTVEQRMSIPTGSINSTYGASGIIQYHNTVTGSANLIGHIERQTTNRIRWKMAGDGAGTYYNDGVPSGTVIKGSYSYWLA